MRNLFDRLPFRYINYIYWLLLMYMLAALAWWYVELVEQNQNTYALQKAIVNERRGPNMAMELARIEDDRIRNAKQYIGEGFTFLIIIVVASGFVYIAVRRQFNLHRQQKNFMMAVTHELKTPIAVTKLSLETLKRHKLDPEKEHKILTDAISETDRLNALCNNILLSSQLDSGGYKMDKQIFNLSQLMQGILSELIKRNPSRKFQPTIEENVMMNGDAFVIGLVMNNLLENAVKYTKSDVLISLILKTLKNDIFISVVDEGEGIPNREKSRIFDKFYRMGDETKRKTQGTGLGLYLSSKIVHDHHGTIRVTDNQPHGAIFTIAFPKG